MFGIDFDLVFVNVTGNCSLLGYMHNFQASKNLHSTKKQCDYLCALETPTINLY